MPMVYSAVVAVSAAALIGVALAVTFFLIRTGVDHEPLKDSYLECDGGWHEAILNECHLGLKRFPQQPVNTYTNLAYVVAGVFIGQLVDTGPSHVFMVSMCFLAVGSAMYHGLSVKWAGHLDVLAIYWVFVGLLIYVAGRLAAMEPALVTVSMFLIAGVTASFLRLVLKSLSIHVKIGILLAPILALELLYVCQNAVPHGYLLVLVSLGLFVIAFLVWFLDRKRCFWPKRWGHGIWHLFTAAAIAILFSVAAS